MKNLIAIAFVLLSVLACDKNDNLVVFSTENDVQLGQQVRDEILNDPSIKILSAAQYPAVYNMLHHVRDGILNSGNIAYKDEFAWEVYVIDNDSTLNAFATPGGYIFVYTGLIKYLDHTDDLAGVMGHEMAHADLRHSIRTLQKTYGVEALLSIALGKDPGALQQIAAQVAGQLAGLQFSRQYETEADNKSVEYLAQTEYACNGAAYFFVKLNANGPATHTPEFLSTHPNPENRIENITTKSSSIGCDTNLSENDNYAEVKASLKGGVVTARES